MVSCMILLAVGMLLGLLAFRVIWGTKYAPLIHMELMQQAPDPIRVRSLVDAYAKDAAKKLDQTEWALVSVIGALLMFLAALLSR